MITTESCDQPTHTPSGINSQAQNATCATATRYAPRLAHQRAILARIRPIPVGHAVNLVIAQPPPTTTAESKPTSPLAQHACAASTARFGLGQMTPVVDTAGDHADTGYPSRAACPPPPSTTSLQADTADPGTHGHRTPTLDTGQRTPRRSDARTGHRAPVAWTGTRGHWTLALTLGHWTPDAGRGRGHGDEGTVGIRPPRPPRQRPRAGPSNRVPVDSAAALGKP
jgi:hypothetical protein